MRDSSLVSIVIPTYNQRPEFLLAAVKSALAQTYQKIEVIVSDNHSDNDCASVLRSLSDERLHLIKPAEHLQLTDHFAFAMEQATGEYVSILSSDDLVMPFWLERLVPAMRSHPNAVVGFGEIADVRFNNIDQVNFYYRDMQWPSGYKSAEDLFPYLVRFDRHIAWTVGDLIRTDAYKAAGGFKSGGLAYSSDWALLIRLLEQGGAVYLADVLGRYRSWGFSEGKTDSLRFSQSVADTMTLFQILEESKLFGPIIVQQADVFRAAKRAKARVLLLGLFEAIALRTLPEQRLIEVKNSLKKLDPSLLFSLSLNVASEDLRVPFRVVYPVARYLYRSKVGRFFRGR